MWYKIAKKNKKETKPLINEVWFEIVPENLWLLRNTEFDVYKSNELNSKNVPVTIYLIRKNKKEVSKEKDLDKALKIAEGLADDKKDSKKDN
jgi:hypothetical protein